MELKLKGKVIKGVGGIYAIRLPADEAARLPSGTDAAENDILYCRARGAFRHAGSTLLPGDNVILRIDTELLQAERSEPKRGGSRETNDSRAGVLIDTIEERSNELIRPPMANLDLLFAVTAAARPEPVLSTLDKLITAIEYKKIEPVVVITKADLAPDTAESIAALYRKCGFTVFVEGVGYPVDELTAFVRCHADETMAFAGASGVGKSTLMNRLFPSLELQTGEISQKTARGKHTTRRIDLFPLDGQFENACGYIADTPGFGMIDLVQFDFYTKEDLPFVFREFAPYLGKCRYTKCTHTKEEGCAVLEAVQNGDIPRERHQSYLAFYEVLKNKHSWDRN